MIPMNYNQHLAWWYCRNLLSYNHILLANSLLPFLHIESFITNLHLVEEKEEEEEEDIRGKTN
jgi:hypothetical protein